MSEYKTLNEMLNIGNNDDHKVDNNDDDILKVKGFQVLPQKKSIDEEDGIGNAIIKHVGNVTTSLFMHVNSYKFDGNENHTIASIVHAKNDLEQYDGQIPILQILIDQLDTLGKEKIKQLGYMSYNFKLYDEYNQQVLTGSNDSDKILNGQYNYTFHINGKVSVIENFIQFKKSNEVMGEMIKYVTGDKQLREMINKFKE